MRSPETSSTRRRLVAHLLQRRLVRLEAELRDEAQRAHEPQRILREARAGGRPQDARARDPPAPQGIDELAGREPARHRVDREVAAPHVFRDRQRGVGDDLEVVPPGPGAHLLARRSELDPGGRQAADRRVARVEGARRRADRRRRDPRRGRAARAPASAPPCRGPARGSRRPSSRARAARRGRRRRRDTRRGPGRGRTPRAVSHVPFSRVVYRCAIASISTSAPDGSFATSTVERAGGRSPTCAA